MLFTEYLSEGGKLQYVQHDSCGEDIDCSADMKCINGQCQCSSDLIALHGKCVRSKKILMIVSLNFKCFLYIVGSICLNKKPYLEDSRNKPRTCLTDSHCPKNYRCQSLQLYPETSFCCADEYKGTQNQWIID